MQFSSYFPSRKSSPPEARSKEEKKIKGKRVGISSSVAILIPLFTASFTSSEKKGRINKNTIRKREKVVLKNFFY